MMDISCAFATSMATPDHIALAEQLGYHRAWCYDSPGLYPDVWMTLALAATRTSRIGLGPGVLVPSLRHPMTNAAAIATLAELAPGRVAVAIGSGFTGRMVLGQRPMKWSEVADYVRALRALLRGEDTEWEGQPIRMLHPVGFGALRPIDVPILIGADGPKGLAVAAEMGDGVFSAGVPAAGEQRPDWAALLVWGTILDDGEEVTSPRAASAVAPGVAVLYHGMYERAGAEVVDSLPNGATWRRAVDDEPIRHIAIHEGHLIEPNDRDRLVTDDALALAPLLTFTGTAADVAARVAAMADAGVTEIAYQHAGPDIPRELEAFARATG